MSHKYLKCASRFVFLLFVSVTTVFGSVIVAHDGQTDPLFEGFSHLNATGLGLADDGGLAAWQITPGTGFSYYFRPLSASEKAEAQNGWSAEGRFRLPAAAPSNPTAAFMNVDFGSVRYDINLYVADSTLYVRANTGLVSGITGNIVALAGSPSDYHYYQLLYDAASNSASLSVDGTPIISGYTGHTDALTDRGLWFGAVGQDANFNTAQMTVGTPEPMTISLIVFGLGAIVLLHRRQKRY